MADNITLKTYKGGNVTPQDDAIIYETAIPGSGIFKGCEVTYTFVSPSKPAEDTVKMASSRS